MEYYLLSLVFLIIYGLFVYFLRWGQLFYAELVSAKTSVIRGLCLVALLTLVNWTFTPQLGFDNYILYIELWIFLILSVLLQPKYSKRGEEPTGSGCIGIVLGILFGIITIIMAFLKWDVFHADYKQKQLEFTQKVPAIPQALSDLGINTLSYKYTTSDSTMDIGDILPPVSEDKVYVVPENVAIQAIYDKMGDLANNYKLGKFTKQLFTGDFLATTNSGQKIRISYKNQMIYVAPLHYKHILGYNGYTPGYAFVDASDRNKTYIITEINHTPLKLMMTYNEVSHRRYLRLHGFASKHLSKESMEIDEKGRPFLTIPTFEYKRLNSSEVITGVAVTDMQTGRTIWYEPQNTPKFIDRIYPKELIFEYVKNWGQYKNGCFKFGNYKNLSSPYEDVQITVDKNGECCYLIAIMPYNTQSNANTIAQMCVSTKTGKAKQIKFIGISPKTARKVFLANPDLDTELEHNLLSLTDPILCNVDGIPSYFANYVSNQDKTVKYYGICSAEDRTIWGYGQNFNEAKQNYLTCYHKKQVAYK